MKFRMELSSISDVATRENFRKLQERIDQEVFLNGEFEHYEVFLDAGKDVTQDFVHNLGFVPRDTILTFVSPDTVSVTFNYDSYTNQIINYTVSAAPVTFRFILGRYRKENF